MSLAQDLERLKRLNNDIKFVLGNDVCTSQSLDIAEDRVRVQKEIVKFLSTKYDFTLKSSPIAEPTRTFQCEDCGDEVTLTQKELDDLKAASAAVAVKP